MYKWKAKAIPLRVVVRFSQYKKNQEENPLPSEDCTLIEAMEDWSLNLSEQTRKNGWKGFANCLERDALPGENLLLI